MRKPSSRRSGVPGVRHDDLGSAKEISAALDRALERRGLRVKLSSNFGVPKLNRRIE